MHYCYYYSCVVIVCSAVLGDFIMPVLRTIHRTILQTIGAIIRLVRHVFVPHNNNRPHSAWVDGVAHNALLFDCMYSNE